MGTITVRLDADEERLLDRLAAVHGDRSAAVRAAIRLLSLQDERRRSMRTLLDDWAIEAGPVSQAEIDETAGRFGL